MTIQVEKDFRGSLGSVRDQGQRPTCLAHATTVAHEFCKGVPSPLSPEYLHFFSTKGKMENGSTVSEMSAALARNGHPIESDCPYGCSNGVKNWKAPKGLTVYRRKSEPRNAALVEIERALSSESVPVLGLALPFPFYDPKPPWVVSHEGPVHGLHAVAAVGIGQLAGKKLILVRNSWGADWGENGHAWLTEDFLKHHFKKLLVLTDGIAA